MSSNRRKTAHADERREQRRMQTCAIVLSILCLAAVGTMALVNRLPMGNHYTYTHESDLWFVDGGEPVIAAPEAPEATPGATVEPDASPSPEPSPEIA